VGRRAPPHGWHLSLERVPVPPIPATGHARLAEIPTGTQVLQRHESLLGLVVRGGA
jgi:hypothetical protein